MPSMPTRTALAAALALAIAAPSAFSAGQIAATSPVPEAIDAARSDSSVLILRSGIFDPTRQQLDFSAVGAAPATTTSYAIVQFQPGQLGARKALAARGVKFLGYVPNNAYYVKATGRALDALRNDAAVRWIGALQPGMKLDPRLWNAQRASSSALQADGRYEINIAIFRGTSSVAVEAALKKLVPGVDIVAKAERPDAPQYVRAATSAAGFDALLRAATSIEGVAFVEPWLQQRPLNSGAIGAIQGDSTSACGGSGPVCGPTPIWDHNIFGSNQIVAISDTGTDANEAWFATLDKGSGPHTEVTFADDPPPVLPAIGTLHPDNKIIGYWVQPGATAYDNTATCPGGDPSVFHGTHTSGTLVGDAAGTFGADTYLASTPTAANHDLADGMAPNAQLLQQDIGNDDSGCLQINDLAGTLEQAVAGGAHIHSDSWGAPTGGTYDGDDANVDFATSTLEDLLFVVAAGNSGPGGTSIGSPGNAKNALTVGALGHAGSTTVAGFSSRGPTADGRQKPDIMAPGTSTISAAGDANTNGTVEAPQTKSLSGTSMATPTIAGNAALMRQFFADGFYPRGTATAADDYNPSGMVMKAVLLNGTDPLQPTSWPNNNIGWGRAWLDGNLWFADTMTGGDDSRRLRFFERTNSAGLATGEQTEYTIANVQAGVELRVTLTWFDPDAANGAASTLVNDLDLEVVDPNSQTYLGNHFTSGVSTTGGTADNKNTVEQVRLTAPVAGGYTLRVKGTSVPGNGRAETDRQGYALAVSGAFGLPDPTPFPAPTGMTVASNDTSGVGIGFSSGSGAQGFQLYRANGTCAAANPGDFRMVADGAAAPLVDDHTQGGFSYAYKVRGVANDVEGDVSTCIDVVSQDDCTLSPQFDTQSLAADANNASCSVALNWSAATASCPASTGVSYTVLRDTDPYFGNPQTLATNVTTPTYTDVGVTDGTPYYYQVIAADSFGNDAPPSRILNTTPAGADGPNPATFFDDVDTHTYLSLETPWQITNTVATDGVFSYRNAPDGANYPDLTCAAIAMPALTIPAGSTLSFNAMYDLEFQWDGVVQEISTDGGANWADLPPDGGYPSSFAQTTNPPVNACGYPASHGAFNGVTTASSNADPNNGANDRVYKPFTTNLGAFAGQNVVIRWRMSSDPSTNFFGFSLDEVHINAPTVDEIFADGFDGSTPRPTGGDFQCH